MCVHRTTFTEHLALVEMSVYLSILCYLLLFKSRYSEKGFIYFFNANVFVCVSQKEKKNLLSDNDLKLIMAVIFDSFYCLTSL